MKRGKKVLKNHHEQKNAKDLQENGSGNQRIINLDVVFVGVMLIG